MCVCRGPGLGVLLSVTVSDACRICPDKTPQKDIGANTHTHTHTHTHWNPQGWSERTVGRRDRGEGGRTLERDIRLREKEGTERQTEGGAAEFKQEGGGGEQKMEGEEFGRSEEHTAELQSPVAIP